MKITKNTLMLTVAGLGLATLLLSAHATPPLKIDFSDETVGAEPKSFVSVVGVWRIESDADNKVLVVDGRQWKQGQTATGIADKARALYGDRYAEFLDRVQAYAYLPYALHIYFTRALLCRPFAREKERRCDGQQQNHSTFRAVECRVLRFVACP